MPLLNVKLLEGVFTPAEKQDVIHKLTDAIVSIKGENIRSATVVIVEEIKSGEWGIGGKAFTTKAVKKHLASGKG